MFSVKNQNLCAILSQMGKHQKALKYSSIALVEIIHQLNKFNKSFVLWGHKTFHFRFIPKKVVEGGSNRDSCFGHVTPYHTAQ